MVSVTVRLMISSYFTYNYTLRLNKTGVQICNIIALVTGSYISYRKRGEHGV